MSLWDIVFVYRLMIFLNKEILNRNSGLNYLCSIKLSDVLFAFMWFAQISFFVEKETWVFNRIVHGD